jgi:hypothetical protein
MSGIPCECTARARLVIMSASGAPPYTRPAEVRLETHAPFGIPLRQQLNLQMEAEHLDLFTHNSVCGSPDLFVISDLLDTCRVHRTVNHTL